MKGFKVVLLAAAMTFVLLSPPAILEANGGHGGHGGWGGHHGGFHGVHAGWGGHHGGFHGGHGGFHVGIGLGLWPGYYWGGYYPYYWGGPVVGWPYGAWPYATYAGWPYVGWPYYPPQGTEAAPPYGQPDQQQPYYWYYCQNPQGYYPYVKSCPGGWMQVIPNVSPPNQ